MSLSYVSHVGKRKYSTAGNMPKDGPLVEPNTVPIASLPNPYQGYPTNQPYGTNSTGIYAY